MSDLLLSYYGDDFTGSTDVMEVLALAGLRTALFLEPPTLDDVRGLQAAGMAGMSRAMSPSQMDRELPSALEALKRLGARLCHYKTCSTFDSSPEVGSIGRAIEIGSRTFGGRFVPLLVGAPTLKRYQIFGNLFATVGAETFRIDRHPVMSRHPVTPMDEGDLRVHLGRQTSASIALFDLLQLSSDVDRRFAALLESKPDIVLFDVLDDVRLGEAGRLIWESGAPFAAGSSGIEYALAAHWKRAAWTPPPAAAVDRLLVVSGSCSSITAGQIDGAEARGFAAFRLGDDTPRLALEALESGQSVVVYTARGPGDPTIRDVRTQGERLGVELGRLARALIEKARLTRLLVAGGDTSGHVARQLGLYALEMVAPIAPGSPLCRARSRDGDFDGLEIAMKGGQVGRPEYFEQVRNGSSHKGAQHDDGGTHRRGRQNGLPDHGQPEVDRLPRAVR